VIDERAIIHPSAKLAKGVTVSPGAIIGADVEIGENTWIGPYAVIEGPTTIGKNNKIFQFTYKGEPTRLEIGDNNIIREYCMISRGTVKGGGLTRIGNDNFLMAYTHVGHDCMLGNHIILINYGALSGHVTVDDYAIIGGYAAVHQFCHVGAYAFVARATYAPKDVLPYIMVAGYASSVYGINTVGLRRRGFSSDTINCLRRAYKIIFRKGLTVQQSIAELELMQNECPEVIPMIDMLNKSTRGIVR
jgi:UDP-N-acetylglucosamine acyltransferase